MPIDAIDVMAEQTLESSVAEPIAEVEQAPVSENSWWRRALENRLVAKDLTPYSEGMLLAGKEGDA
jgi:hypothetical protein